MKLKLTQDSRAARLLESLDAKYFQFADDLPPPFRDMALMESTIVGQPIDEPFQGPSKMNPLIACTPWLFWETYCELDDETFLYIAEAGAFISLASVLMDHLVDGQAEQPEAMALFQRAVYDHGVAGFRAMFSKTSTFWRDFERLSREYLTALGAEIDAQSNPERFTQQAFFASAAGKVSPIAITIAALSEASGQPSILEPIEISFRHSFIAGQIHDDVLDWRSDVENRHLTFFMTRLAPPETWPAAEWPSVDELEAINDTNWVDVNYFDLVIDHFDRCIKDVDGIQCAGWIKYLVEYRGVAEEHQKAAVARHLLRVLGPVIQPLSD